MTRHLWFLLLAVLGVSGCGLTANQRAATTKFADAATAFGDASANELTKMRDQTVAMNLALYRIPDPPSTKANPNESAAVAYIEHCKKVGHAVVSAGATEKPCEYDNLAADFSGDWFETFLSGPQVMKAYGAALSGIMNADSKDDIKKSSDDLAAALQAIPGSPAANASADAISDLAQQLTELILDNMKAHAIHAVVESTKNTVPIICKTVGDNFSLERDGFAFRFRNTAAQLAIASGQAINANPRDRLARSDSLSGYLLARQNLEEVDTAFPEIQKSAAACVAANTALVNALQNTTFNRHDIEEFYAAALTAASNVGSLKSHTSQN
ncbi:MAG TPA: hypothetical protein VKS22_04405 [Candidatus Binataceae bacterium]|nr:hypothetical protein [Candidatus Binataceae bacterium]